MPCPRQGNEFQEQRRRFEGPSDFRYFKNAQTKLFWRKMKIILHLQCMLKFNTLKSLARSQNVSTFEEREIVNGKKRHKPYNSAWCCTFSKNPLLPLIGGRRRRRPREGHFKA